jgi:fructose-bisphosphate aldolase class II
MGDIVSYKELGFVNTREMFKKAMEGGYAIPAYNFNNMEQLQAILTACVKSGSPVILQVSKGARSYATALSSAGWAAAAWKWLRSLPPKKARTWCP